MRLRSWLILVVARLSLISLSLISLSLIGLSLSGCANDCYSGVGISKTCSRAGESCEMPDGQAGICLPDRDDPDDTLDCVAEPDDQR